MQSIQFNNVTQFSTEKKSNLDLVIYVWQLVRVYLGDDEFIGGIEVELSH